MLMLSGNKRIKALLPSCWIGLLTNSIHPAEVAQNHMAQNNPKSKAVASGRPKLRSGGKTSWQAKTLNKTSKPCLGGFLMTTELLEMMKLFLWQTEISTFTEIKKKNTT